MNLKLVFWCLGLVALCLLLEQTAFCAKTSKKTYNQIMLGGGSSWPGWGITTERVQTLDIIPRHCRPFFEKNDGWIRGAHEFWIESPISIILHDSDANDSHDYGIVGLNFLFAWIFPDTKIGNPYFMFGGGPQYIMADIEGVGSDICGNYQIGVGIRFNITENHPVNLEMRYHHISNLGMADPNVSLNSTKIFVGFMLPF